MALPLPRIGLGLGALLAAVLSLGAGAQARGLSAPKPASPGAGAHVQSLPTFAWGAVRGASHYEFQLAADSRFRSIVKAVAGNGAMQTPNLAATLDKALANGTYYWRVRGVTRSNSSGAWSKARKLVEAWTATPESLSPEAATLQWPSQPATLQWSVVAHAVRYQVEIATDPQLAHLVVGTAAKPPQTQGTIFSPNATLTPGTYFWAVTPLDAEGHKGARSAIASFTVEWPSSTSTSVQNLSEDPRVFEPLFSWAPVPGAARYEVEVNSASGFPTGSKWCCSTTTLGTSFAPLQTLANNEYFWRVRAIDANGNAGVWNYGATFTKAFDSVTPSIPSLGVQNPPPGSKAEQEEEEKEEKERTEKREQEEKEQAGKHAFYPLATKTPIVTWEPVPGASSYEVQVAPYGGGGCNWSTHEPGRHLDALTATTAWTPLGHPRLAPEAGWPSVQQDQFPLEADGTEYCVRVLAQSDNDAKNNAVASEWTQVNGLGRPAFKYDPAHAAGSPEGLLATPATAYRLPAGGSFTPRTPVFDWAPVKGATGYFVTIARDAGMTHVINVGFTNVPAYAPRLDLGAPYADETTAYYWAAVPSREPNGDGVFTQPSQDSPQAFNKSSTPPTLLAPGAGELVSAQPTFRWTRAENARKYELQVSTEESFATTLEDVTTDATAYSSGSTYPANALLYWRVRGSDWTGQGLNWSAVQTFQRGLPAPSLGSNALSGELIPALNWSAPAGATGYEVHVEKVSGGGVNFKTVTPVFTPTEWYGVGVWHWQVRALYPANRSGLTVTSAYTSRQQFVRTLAPPSKVSGTRRGRRLVLSWRADPAAKQYEVQLSHSNGFAKLLERHRTDNTSWAPTLDTTSASGRGTLYWRVAAIDVGGNVGSFASGRFGSASRTCKKGRRIVPCPKPHRARKHR